MTRKRPRRSFSRIRRRIALASSVVMMGTLLQAVTQPAVAVDKGTGRPSLPAAEKPVAGHTLKPRPRPAVERLRPSTPPDRTWPKAASVLVELPPAGKARSKRLTKAAGLPLELESRAVKVGKPVTGAVEAHVHSRAAARRAGVDGVVFTLRPKESGSTGQIGARLDYSRFAEAYGGGYASRLTLVELPACSLTTPAKRQCRTAKPVTTVNDTERQRLTARTVSLRAGQTTVLAAVAATGSDKGDYKATSLAPSATWSTGLNTGDFSWSYGMPTPEVPGSFAPTVGIAYSSGGVDGRTGNSNNQSSWVGDGFSMWPGYIERRYKPCADDGVENAQGMKPGDQCWAYDNAFVSFNGKAGELVPAGTDSWKLRNDDGTRIDRLESADRANGDNDNEYWRLTDPSGARYYFGYNRLPGWTTGKETTDSTWTVPVYGDDAGEKCHGSIFATSWCQQGYRWNLDYAVDPHGNAIAYYYDKETNSYGRNLEATDDTPYVRGGTLDRIEYGLKSTSMYTTKALAKVNFTNSERCLPTSTVDCSNIATQKDYWYDTPWDLNCTAGTTCDQGRLSPSYFTRKRLTEITTQVFDGTAYKNVDSWKLDHSWGMADTDYQLRLASIQRTGHTATPAITQPKTTFGYTQLANRLDKTGDGLAPFIKDRLSTVFDESGGQIDVNYSAPVCNWANLPTPHTNTTRCFPQYMGGSATEEPSLEWFNKYVVSSVTQTDRTGRAPDQVTAYSYQDEAAWHYDDDDGLTKEKHKTWSQWRGYGHVRVQSGGQGGGAAMKSQQDSYFLRGMHGDRENTAGGTKNVTVTLGTGEGDPITDHESAAGFGYKTVTFSGPGGNVLSKAVHRPWKHQTAVKTRDWGTITANFTGTKSSKSYTSLDNGAGTDWRTTSSENTHDTIAGRVIQVDDHGDNSTASDNKCVRTTYPADSTILTLPTRVQTAGTACGPLNEDFAPAGVLSDVRTAYDGAAYDAAPAKGVPTRTALLTEYDGTTAVYLESSGTHDTYGRPLTTTDLTADVRVTAAGALTRTPRTDGRTTTTVRTPATGFTTGMTVTTPPATAGNATTALKTTTTHEPLRGLPLTQTDTNGKITTFTYDALGRASKVWLADRATTLAPTHEFTYHAATDTAPAAVGTKSLGNNGVQFTSYVLYDGFLRPRQTQEPGPNGGRLISDTFYDERGLAHKEFAPYYATTAPQTGLFKPEDALNVETQNRYTHDGLGRQTELRQIAGNGDGGTVLNITKTIHGGDRTTTIPPTGGTATTTLVDAQGKTTALRQHHQPNASAAFDETQYAYTRRGELSKVTDAQGNEWAYTYDLAGRQVTNKDPDKGTTTSTYDDRGQLLTTHLMPQNVKLANVYDNLGRRTELRKDSATGPLRAKWTYDTITGAKGHLAETTRYDDDNDAYTSKIVAYDRLYRPLRTSVTIPATEGALAGTYLSTATYNVSGLPQGIGYPAAGALPAASVVYAYEDKTLRPTTVDGSQGVKALTSYSLTGKPLQHELSRSTGKKTWVTNGYEWGTQRLATSRVDRQDVPGVDQSNTYRYDDAGNVLAVSDVSRSGTDNQCFQHDFARRITQAWTQPTTTCATTPSAAAVGGPAPYWHSYTYDVLGNRSTETLHDTTGDTAKDITRTYAHPVPAANQPPQPRPHRLNSVTATGPGGISSSYTYDDAGNTRTRTIGTTTQTLDWDAEGHLAKVTEPVPGSTAKVTEYLYDTDGNRLIARTPTETTLYLGNTEISLPKGTTTASATRYIDLGGGHEAVQQNDGTVSFTLADHHGTAQLAVDATTQQTTQRRSLPFGGKRGLETTGWPGTKGFVGGTDDTKSTGLTHLGAREYDPTIGRFISVDPLLETDKPQTLNGYTYAAQNPLTFTDPSGLGLGCGPGPNQEECPTNPSGGKSGQPDKIGSPSDGGGGGGGGLGLKPPAGVKSDGDSISIQGKRIPTQSELITIFPQYSENLSYQRNLELWIRAYPCTDKPFSPFCTAVGKLGWFGGEPENNILKLLGVDDYWNCATGKSGNSCKAAASDAALATLTGGFGKAAKVIFKAIKTSIKNKKSVPANCLIAAFSGGNSFKAGTLVLMADGTTKPIETVRVGDMVLATDPSTGETAAKRVSAELIHHDDDLIDITIKNDDGREATLRTTEDHPFWDKTTQSWKLAGELTERSSLTTPDDRRVPLTSVRTRAGSMDMHDLTVADIHTYYVLAGTTPVLVHNSNGLCGVTSAIHDDPYLVKAAESAGKNQRIQKEMDDLVMQFRGGNTNPGLGNKSLAGTDVSYLRGRNGGRVFFRNTGDGMQIVGKADKSNESKVISRLTDMYGN